MVPSRNAGKQEKKKDGISVLKSHPSDADPGTHRWRRGRGVFEAGAGIFRCLDLKRVIMFWAFLTKAVGMRHAMKEVAYG